MSLNSFDRLFLNKWTQLDFTAWNESDVREEFIAPLLKIFGYSKGTVNDIIREHHLKLSHAYHRIGRKSVSIDYVPTVRLKSFWIIEAKPGNPRNMNFGDLLQAHLYAIHPEVQARFIVLTNGWEIRVYDAMTVDSWESPLHICTQQDCFDTFEELKKMLGAREMLSFQRERIIQVLQNTFAVEVDEAQVTLFQSAVKHLIAKSLPIVHANARQLELAAWKESNGQEKKRLQEQEIESLLADMNNPIDGRIGLAEEYLRRISESDPSERNKLVDLLAQNFRGRPHAVFRALSNHVLLKLLENNIEVDGSAYVHSIKDSLEELAIQNFTYWKTNELSNALCHLDNTALRIAKKVGMRLAMDPLSKWVSDLKMSLAAEDRLKQRPTVAKFMVGFIGLLGEALWMEFCSANDATYVWQGIWLYELIEQMIEQIPVKSYPDGDADLLFFESYGRGFDMLFMGTWRVLYRNVNILRNKNISASVISLAALQREEAMQRIPSGKERPKEWQPDKQLFGQLSEKILSKHLGKK